MTADPDGRGIPLVEVLIEGGAAGLDAAKVAEKLRSSTPSIRVDASKAPIGVLTLVPTCLRIGDAEPIGRAFARALHG
jgi:hypothetical protein